MRLALAVIALAALAGCKSKPADLPPQPNAATAGDSLRKVGTELEARSGKVAAAVTVARDNADKPEVVRAETGVALSSLPVPSPDDLLVARARASRADQKDYAAAEAAGKKARADLDAALAKAKADQEEAKRVSDLKDARIKQLEAELDRVKKDKDAQWWTIAGVGVAVIGAVATALAGPRVGLPLLACGAAIGAFPLVTDSPHWDLIVTLTLSAGAALLIWVAWDYARDRVNAKNPPAE